MTQVATYDPLDWHWIVAGDESRYWSSAAGAYVASLPDDAGVTRIASEAELTDVLRPYGLRGPAYSVDEANGDLVALLSAVPSAILASYPEGEPQSWPAKEAEAVVAAAVGTPAPADYPLLRDEIAATLGIDGADVTSAQISAKASAVLAKAAAWRALVSRIAGLRQRYSAALEAAGSAAERADIIAEVREELAAG